jgi:hypothetical protein
MIRAINLAAVAVVLVYGEKLKIHLTLDGSDIIELCCIHFLQEIGYDMRNLPPFSHSTAISRLQSWRNSTFPTPYGTTLTGDHLVRQATGKVTRLIESTASAFRESRLVYWLLEDALRGIPSQAIKAPTCHDTSWHTLAFSKPPLIFVVGELDDNLVTTNNANLKWTYSKERPSSGMMRPFKSQDFSKTESA